LTVTKKDCEKILEKIKDAKKIINEDYRKNLPRLPIGVLNDTLERLEEVIKECLKSKLFQ